MKQTIYILSFIITLIFASCTSQVDEQLQSAEEYYIEHHSINDSIDYVLSQIETAPGTRQDKMKRILHATNLFRKMIWKRHSLSLKALVER